MYPQFLFIYFDEKNTAVGLRFFLRKLISSRIIEISQPDVFNLLSPTGLPAWRFSRPDKGLESSAITASLKP